MRDSNNNINATKFNGKANTAGTSDIAKKIELTTYITLGGVPFYGDSIDLPGVNIKGNQSTTGKADTAGIADNSLSLGDIAAADYALGTDISNGSLTMRVSGIGIGLSGSDTFTANQSNNTTFTVTSNATSGNYPGTLVSRDNLGNFQAQSLTLNGNLNVESASSNLATLPCRRFIHE